LSNLHVIIIGTLHKLAPVPLTHIDFPKLEFAFMLLALGSGHNDKLIGLLLVKLYLQVRIKIGHLISDDGIDKSFMVDLLRVEILEVHDILELIKDVEYVLE